MVDDVKPTFIKCLIHETKSAYIPYFKCLGVIALFILVMVGIYVVTLLCPYEEIGKYLKIAPWYVYALLLILSPPGIYACIECLKRRIDKQTVSIAGVILIILACIFFFVGFATVSLYLIIIAIICGIIGFWIM